jgi:hypothetical protein
MVTTRFFTFFPDLFGEKPKWTFINVQNRFATNKSIIIYFFVNSKNKKLLLFQHLFTCLAIA